MKRVQVEPHLSVTGACSAKWVPIKPKTDAAFLYALLHVMVHEVARDRLDLAYLRESTSSPYLVGDGGYFLRDPATRKPLIWDETSARAVPHDTPGTRPALEGAFEANAIEIGADDAVLAQGELRGRPSFACFVEHMSAYSPEWAEGVCDVSAATIREVAMQFVEEARVGETIEIDGLTLPLRPVAVSLGKTVTNGWGAFECVWARTMLVVLVGALEVPGGALGTTVRLSRPMSERIRSVRPGEDGFMAFPFNPTDREGWSDRPNIRNAYRTMVPISADGPWSQALGPTHFSWMFLDDTPKGLPKVTLPELWFVYRTNPAISFWDTTALTERIARFPFVVAFAYTHDETNHMADILLPDCVDLESLQLIRIGGSKYIEQFWDHEGYALRQPVVAPRGEARDFTDIATELAVRTDLLEKYNAAINKGAAGAPLSGEGFDYRLDTSARHGCDTIWEAVCRAASSEISHGEEAHGLEWFRENGFMTRPFPRVDWYLYPAMRAQGLRFELPYQERLKRIGEQLGNRLHERDLHWWDAQLKEYQALPVWSDFPGKWEQALVSMGGSLESYPFWLVTARSMQYAWGANAGIPLMHEVAGNVAGHRGVVVNTARARALGIEDGDQIEISTPVRSTRGRAVLRQGIRPDTLLMIGQFDHWATPVAKDFEMPSMNTLVPMSLALTDATGSGADLVRVSLRKTGQAR